MTADKLQSIVLRIANAAPTRYWLHYNYPTQGPWLMAIKVFSPIGTARLRNPEAETATGRQLVELGGTWDEDFEVWIFERTNEDGTPFTSNL